MYFWGPHFQRGLNPITCRCRFTHQSPETIRRAPLPSPSSLSHLTRCPLGPGGVTQRRACWGLGGLSFPHPWSGYLPTTSFNRWNGKALLVPSEWAMKEALGPASRVKGLAGPGAQRGWWGVRKWGTSMTGRSGRPLAVRGGWAMSTGTPTSRGWEEGIQGASRCLLTPAHWGSPTWVDQGPELNSSASHQGRFGFWSREAPGDTLSHWHNSSPSDRGAPHQTGLLGYKWLSVGRELVSSLAPRWVPTQHWEGGTQDQLVPAGNSLQIKRTTEHIQLDVHTFQHILPCAYEDAVTWHRPLTRGGSVPVSPKTIWWPYQELYKQYSLLMHSLHTQDFNLKEQFINEDQNHLVRCLLQHMF